MLLTRRGQVATRAAPATGCSSRGARRGSVLGDDLRFPVQTSRPRKDFGVGWVWPGAVLETAGARGIPLSHKALVAKALTYGLRFRFRCVRGGETWPVQRTRRGIWKSSELCLGMILRLSVGYPRTHAKCNIVGRGICDFAPEPDPPKWYIHGLHLLPCGTDRSKQRPNLPNLGSHGPAQVHALARPDLTHYHHGL
jgi:hypothetical protein